MYETATIPVVNTPKGNVIVEFEKEDFSIGAARYRDAKPITKNLAMKPAGRGGQATPMPHANIKVRLFDEQGRKVPMTRRLVRTWDIRPLEGASVENLRMWHIVGLEQTEFSPFSPFPVSRGERPGDANFKWDRPGQFDAPGLQFIKLQAFGILQEFVSGNRAAGGAYFQTYTLFDGAKFRTINSRAVQLSKDEYAALLDSVDSGAYTKAYIRKLYWMPAGQTDAISALPPNRGTDGDR